MAEGGAACAFGSSPRLLTRFARAAPFYGPVFAGKNSLSQVANVSGGSLKYNGTAANLAFQQAANQSSAYNGQAQQLSFNTSSAAYSSLQDVAHDQALQARRS